MSKGHLPAFPTGTWEMDGQGNYIENCSTEGAAEAAYEYADAMMKARGDSSA